MHIAGINPALLLATVLLALMPSASADSFWQEDVDWLKTMAFAAHQTDYTGIFVYQYGNHVESSRITHIADRDGGHGRLEGMDGSQRGIIHDNDEIRGYQEGHLVSMGYRPSRRLFPALLPQQLALLKENYQIKKSAGERVAGFHTTAFIFQPRDNLRYTHKMWAHSDSGLLLKVAVLDERGRVIEQYAFTQLSIGGDIDRKWLESGKSDPGFCAREQNVAVSAGENAADNASGWQVASLPPGFKKTMEMRRPLRGQNALATQMMFSDGLAGISVFIENLTGHPNVNSSLTSQGAIQIYSKVNGEYLVTVVGEVPARTLMRVAESIRHSSH